MTLPLLAVEAHRAIDRRDALVALLDGAQPQRFQMPQPDLDVAVPFIAACQRVYVSQHQVERGA